MTIDLNEEISKDLIERWIDSATTLKAVKEEEMDLRKEICGSLQEADSRYGTLNFDVHDFRLKATFGLSYKIDEAALEAIKGDLTEADLACIRWKPQLDVAAFKALGSDLLNEIVIVTPAAPSLKVG
jgi:hypothetical protein